MNFNTIPEALQDLKQGKIILVTDDPDRVPYDKSNAVQLIGKHFNCPVFDSGRSLDLLFMPAASQQGRFSHTDHGKSGRAFEKYKCRYLPGCLPPEHKCDHWAGRDRSGTSDYFSGHGASGKMRHFGSRRCCFFNVERRRAGKTDIP